MAYRKKFHPWRRDFAWAAAFALLSGVSLYGVVEAGPIYAVPALVFWLIARWFFKSYSRRTYGHRVERAALALLRLTCPWPIAGNVPVPGGGGDIDAVVEGPCQRRFAVEIKSWAGLRVLNGRLVRASGRSLMGNDPIVQCLREASAIGATAVMWLPTARATSAFWYRKVLIINGSARFLDAKLRGTHTHQPSC